MAIKLREKLVNTDTFTVGAAAVERGCCLVLNAGVVATSGANAGKFIGIAAEAGAPGQELRVAQGGSTVLAQAADGAVAEGDWLVSDNQGRVITAGAAAIGVRQNLVGYALKASGAVGQLIPVVVWPARVDHPAA